MLNRHVLHELNMANNVADAERQRILRLLEESGDPRLVSLAGRYCASMEQDADSAWLATRPKPPEILTGTVEPGDCETFDIVGIGGMFAYLNVLYQAHKNGGRHAIISHPHDIFTFAGWTVHPEEDMDQRLIQMFQTRSMVVNEAARIMGLAEGPASLRYKSFRIDYRSMASMAVRNRPELRKNVEVALHYSFLEMTDKDNKYARVNLKRNQATLRALREMDLVGDRPEHDVINLCGRVVFEVDGERSIERKKHLREEYGIAAAPLGTADVEEVYGGSIGMLEEMRARRVKAVRYPGGHFLAGHRENAFACAQQKNVEVYDRAVATKVIVDPASGKHGIEIRLASGAEKRFTADTLLIALGDYGSGIITIDGVSALFAVVTEDRRYRLYPTGMGEGGTIHVVPVWSFRSQGEGKTIYAHVGKATDGAIMGRDPALSKSIESDRSFLLHLEANLKRIIPRGATFVWLAATECGRPVSALQGYSIAPLLEGRNKAAASRPGYPLSFKATGGCGLGANTAIIPEVQELLDSRIKR